MSADVPQVFVGTLYCGEGEYDSCCRAILSQKGVQVEHVVIANLSEKDAHNRLWQEWRQRQTSGFDMFVKVDADVELAHDEVLLELWNLMKSDPTITGIQAPLSDYYTDKYIAGLNCFNPRVTFNDTTDELKCDRGVDTGHERVIGMQQCPDCLQPAGFHCFNNTDAQAFHFGLHRKMKGHEDILITTRQAWQRCLGRPRALALLGAMHVTLFDKTNCNYADTRFKDVLEDVLLNYESNVRALTWAE